MKEKQFLFSRDEIVPCVMTGLKYYDRAKACRDTWLQDFEKYYIFGDTPDASVPITSIKGAGEDWHSHRAKRFMGLAIAYNENPNTEWFFCLSCDNFVFNKNLRNFLNNIENLRGTPAYVGGHSGSYERLAGLVYASGGAGYLLSRKAIPVLTNNLGLCLTLSEAEDVTVGAMMRIAGVPYYQADGFHGCNPTDLKHECKLCEELAHPPLTFHYMKESDIRKLDGEERETR